jgi:hypothetical protein
MLYITNVIKYKVELYKNIETCHLILIKHYGGVKDAVG